MVALFEPRASMRASTHSHYMSTPTPTAADTLPSIDFGFDELRACMASFSSRFDAFIAEGRKRVLAERNQHRSRLAELHEDQHLKARSIALLQQQRATHASTVQKEAQETLEMQAAIAGLAASRDGHAGNNARLRREIASAREAVRVRVAAQEEFASAADRQMALNGPELEFYEAYLGLRIECPEPDRVSFVFSCVDERDWEAEYEVTLDLARRDYWVTETRPELESARVEAVLGLLNEGRDLGPFLKGMRGLFADKCREERRSA